MTNDTLNQKQAVFREIRSGITRLEDLGPALRSDREVVLEAVKNVLGALEYASDEFRSDREVVLEAMNNCGDGDALYHVSEDLRSDPIIKVAAGVKVKESELYLAAYEEVETGSYDKDLFGNALKETGGKISDAKDLYIKMRVSSLIN